MSVEKVIEIVSRTHENSFIGCYFEENWEDLKTIVQFYDDHVLAPQRALVKLQERVEWVKTLDSDPTTKTPICVCGSVMPEKYLMPAEGRESFLKWTEEHFEHRNRIAGMPLHIVKPCDFRDVLQSECVLPLGHEGDHQMVNGTNEENHNEEIVFDNVPVHGPIQDTELKGILNTFQEQHDLKPSEMFALVLRVVDRFKPTDKL